MSHPISSPHDSPHQLTPWPPILRMGGVRFAKTLILLAARTPQNNAKLLQRWMTDWASTGGFVLQNRTFNPPPSGLRFTLPI